MGSLFLRRLAEPSTAAGIAGMISTGAAWASGAMPAAAALPSLLGSLFAILAPERARVGG